MSKPNLVADVKEFQREILNAKVFEFGIGGPLPVERKQFFKATIAEELDELSEALESNDQNGVVDALCDIVYFAIGHAYQSGLDFQGHWEKVHSANMKKKLGRTERGEVDAIKPEGWDEPITETHVDEREIEPLPALFFDAHALMFRKSQDYNNGGTDSVHDYFIGELGYVQMIYTKARRLVSLAKLSAANPGSSPNFESKRDSLLDICNYANLYDQFLEMEGRVDV